MVDRVGKHISERFAGFKGMYMSSESPEWRLSIQMRVSDFVEGLCCGLNRQYVKRIWGQMNMNECFAWPLASVPYRVPERPRPFAGRSAEYAADDQDL